MSSRLDRRAPVDALGDSLVDEKTGQFTTWLAARSPRRSFLGTMGRLALVTVGGGAAGLTFWTESAYAVGCGCGVSDSVTCSCLSGDNGCPGATCECGCWSTCDNSEPCYPNRTHWCDCCDTNGCTTDCIGGCGGKPKCCFTKEHHGGCGQIGSDVIRCRMRSCGSAC